MKQVQGSKSAPVVLTSTEPTHPAIQSIAESGNNLPPPPQELKSNEEGSMTLLLPKKEYLQAQGIDLKYLPNPKEKRKSIVSFNGQACMDTGKPSKDGTFSQVFQFVTPTGFPIAVKRIIADDDASYKNHLQHAMRDVEVQIDICIKRGVPLNAFLFASPKNREIRVVCPWLEEPTLEEAMQKAETLDEVFALLEKTLIGLEGLHADDIIHGDLKSNNIKLYQGHILFIDFGLSRYKGRKEIVTPVPAGYKYFAPECREPNTPIACDPSQDIYSFGHMARKMISAKNKLAMNDEHKKFFEEFRLELKPLVAKDPSQRPNILAIKKIFAEIKTNLNTIKNKNLLLNSQEEKSDDENETLKLSDYITERTSLRAILGIFWAASRNLVQLHAENQVVVDTDYFSRININVDNNTYMVQEALFEWRGVSTDEKDTRGLKQQDFIGFNKQLITWIKSTLQDPNVGFSAEEQKILQTLQKNLENTTKLENMASFLDTAYDDCQGAMLQEENVSPFTSDDLGIPEVFPTSIPATSPFTATLSSLASSTVAATTSDTSSSTATSVFSGNTSSGGSSLFQLPSSGSTNSSVITTLSSAPSSSSESTSSSSALFTLPTSSPRPGAAVVNDNGPAKIIINLGNVSTE